MTENREYIREPIRKLVSTILLELGAVKIAKDDEEPFEYTSKNRGNIYIDNRILVSHNPFKKMIAGFMHYIISKEIPEKISLVFGGETAGMNHPTLNVVNARKRKTSP